VKSFEDKTVVITGGANGVGRALGVVFAKEKANVVLVDIHQDNLDTTVAELGADNVVGMSADVTDPASMQALADRCFETYGNVHVLINNAGVGLGEASRPMWTLPARDWDWGLSVNTTGPVNGIRAFVPRMMESGEECVVVNTSSGNGGITSLPTTPIYAASKAAVTSLTEVLHYQLLKAESKVRAAVMFPGPNVVNTNILNSADSRPDKFTPEGDNKPRSYLSMTELSKNSGLGFALTEPAEVAEYTVEGIRDGLFWILPPEYGPQLDKLRARTDSICSRRTPGLP